MVRIVFAVALLFLLSAFAEAQNNGNCPSPPPISAKEKALHANTENLSEATVSVLVVISDTGYVCSAHVLHGVDKLIDAEAVEAVRGWQFSPATKNGHPIPVTAAVDVKFRRDENSKLVVVSQPPSEPRTGTLMKRETKNGVDNYPYAAYSFKFGGNGLEIQKLCRNNWELLFGNSPEPDSFDVTMVTDDRSRIRDLGSHIWGDKFAVPNLPEYEKPQKEPSVKAIEGHVYVVHARDTDTDLYALFRVEKLVPGERAEITWKLIPAPQK